MPCVHGIRGSVQLRPNQMTTPRTSFKLHHSGSRLEFTLELNSFRTDHMAAHGADAMEKGSDLRCMRVAAMMS